MKTIIAANLLRAKRLDIVSLTDYKGRSIEGEIAFIFPANLPKRLEDIKKYYGLEEGDRSFRAVQKTARYDVMAIRYSNDPELYYMVSRIWETTRWLNDFTIVKGAAACRN